MTFPRSAALAFSAFLALAACQTPEEKAEEFYQSGLALLEAGDTDRALVEFRNVFEYNGFHKEARQTYAETQLARGELAEAYAQYLRLIEQYPDEVDARLTLAELAVARGDWAEVRRHGDAAIDLAPDRPDARAIQAAIAYRAAVSDLDAIAARAAEAQARAVLDGAPDNIIALRLLIDAAARSDTPATALPLLDDVLAVYPDALEFHVTKLRILSEDKDNEAAAIAQLQVMFDRFPDNPEVRGSLVGWHLSQQDYDTAEALLRELAGPATGDTGGHVTLVQFLQGARGTDVATAELHSLVLANAGTPKAELYRAMQAAIDFESGDQTGAIAHLREIVADADTSDQTLQIRIMLARMLDTTGDHAAARAEVDSILATDTAHVPALKMQASWLIDDDMPDAAITTLRTALNQSPRDAEILTLMAEAHSRAGSPELAGERLALAVDVSGNAPDAALRYVQFLIQNGRNQAAETVLLDARRAHPANLEIASRLADLWLRDQNWAAASALLQDLRESDAPQAASIAATLQAEILMGQNQIDESLEILQDQLAGMDDTTRATITIVMAHIRSGKLDEARNYLDLAQAKAPDDITLRLLSGSLAMMTGDQPIAEATFRAVLDEAPATEAASRLLFSLYTVQGEPEAASAVLDAGISADPQAGTLLWIKAGVLEKSGDIDGAIGIYDALYDLNSSNVIVANNLASLLATHRDDADSLDRAYTIARRLRGMDVPAFQDTYGWIAARRGDYVEALTYLRPAAAGLPDDPLVQFHLGMTFKGLNRNIDARNTLIRTLEIAGDSPLPQFDAARAALAVLGTQ